MRMRLPLRHFLQCRLSCGGVAGADGITQGTGPFYFLAVVGFIQLASMNCKPCSEPNTRHILKYNYPV